MHESKSCCLSKQGVRMHQRDPACYMHKRTNEHIILRLSVAGLTSWWTHSCRPALPCRSRRCGCTPAHLTQRNTTVAAVLSLSGWHSAEGLQAVHVHSKLCSSCVGACWQLLVTWNWLSSCCLHGIGLAGNRNSTSSFQLPRVRFITAHACSLLTPSAGQSFE